MMKTAAVWTSLVASAAAFGQAPADGFYLLADDAAVPSLPSSSGNTVRVGIAQDIRVDRSVLYALDNANSQFVLTIWVSPESSSIDSQFALVVSGYAHVSGSGTEGYDSVTFVVAGAEDAENVARYLGTAVDYKRHPKHELLVQFIPTEGSFQVGDEVRAKLRIENVGANAVAFMQGGRYRGTRDNQYVFSAWLNGRGVQDIGSNMNRGGLEGMRVLAPGETFGDEVSLSKWFAFDQPGYYEIHGSYFMDFLDPESQSFRSIWADYVSADFTVRVGD